MRTNGTGKFSPDDGDHEGFLKLMRQWVEEFKVPVPDRDVVWFSQRFSFHRPAKVIGELRTPKQWIKLLRQYSEQREKGYFV